MTSHVIFHRDDLNLQEKSNRPIFTNLNLKEPR